jgi:hypothetical protein
MYQPPQPPDFFDMVGRKGCKIFHGNGIKYQQQFKNKSLFLVNVSG